jgi:hypothetical protein
MTIVTIVALANVVSSCAAMWVWLELLAYVGQPDILGPYLYSGAPPSIVAARIIIWLLPVCIVLNITLALALWTLHNWARKTLIVLYVLSAVVSLFNFNVIGIIWSLVSIVLLTRPNVMEAFTGQMSRVDYSAGYLNDGTKGF